MTMPLIVFAGCGALGSRIAMEIARPGWRVRLIDDDVVEAGNIASLTTAYSDQHIGAAKVFALAEMLWRMRGCEATAMRVEATERNARSLFADATLVVDTFDNPQARLLTINPAWPAVHAAVSEHRTGWVAWRDYEPPTTLTRRGENPVCTRNLGVPILRFTASVAARIIEQFIETGAQRTVYVDENLTLI